MEKTLTLHDHCAASIVATTRQKLWPGAARLPDSPPPKNAAGAGFVAVDVAGEGDVDAPGPEEDRCSRDLYRLQQPRARQRQSSAVVVAVAGSHC